MKSSPGTDPGTRARILRLLLAEGPATAGTLAERLGLSAAAVRRHLEALEADGAVTPARPSLRAVRLRGRPARVYALSDTGHDIGGHDYDDLAAGALGFLAATSGPAALASFARARADDLRTRLEAHLGEVAPAERPARLAAALSAQGYAATVHTVRGGMQICQHHCPVAHVAAAYPALCEAETEVLGRLLGSHVQRLATIARGDLMCTTHVPASTARLPVPSATAKGAYR